MYGKIVTVLILLSVQQSVQHKAYPPGVLKLSPYGVPRLYSIYNYTEVIKNALNLAGVFRMELDEIYALYDDIPCRPFAEKREALLLKRPPQKYMIPGQFCGPDEYCNSMPKKERGFHYCTTKFRFAKKNHANDTSQTPDYEVEQIFDGCDCTPVPDFLIEYMDKMD